MKLRVLILTALLGAWACGAADLTQVKSVYFFSMANGFDQYLANRVTHAGIFEVVANPKAADAVFTDELGAGFEARLEEISPSAAPAAEQEPAKEGEEKEADSGRGLGDTKATGAVPSSSLRRGKGMVFLVDVKSRRVLWSAYEQPKNTSSRELDRASGRLVKVLQAAVTPTKK